MSLRSSLLVVVVVALSSCNKASPDAIPSLSGSATAETPTSNTPPLDAKNIVTIASASKDHTTLVAALKAADYVTSVAASGPLTVFAPTNAAFDKLPKGTVEGLLKPEKVDDLRNILKYHVTTSAHPTSEYKDGDVIAMANGKKATIHVAGDKVKINDANIVASIPCSNGIIHVIDGVLLPPTS